MIVDADDHPVAHFKLTGRQNIRIVKECFVFHCSRLSAPSIEREMESVLFVDGEDDRCARMRT
jgi:hypothetical protein